MGIRRYVGLAAGAALNLALAGASAHAVELCAWLTETADEDDFREVALWLRADADANFYYMIKGRGLVDESSRMHSPSKGTFVLSAGEAEKPWGMGATLTPPAEIDIIAEIRATPTDVFSDDEPPLLATFTFHRDIQEGETETPATLAEPQCQSIIAAGSATDG